MSRPSLVAMERAIPSRFLVLFIVLGITLGVAPSAAQVTIDEARQQGVGADVTVEGTVTRAYGDFVRLQDASGPTGASALVVRQTSGGFYDDVQGGTIAKGTQLEVSGTLSEFNGLLQINEEDLSGYSVQGDGSVPPPQSVTLETLSAGGEEYESVLVEVGGLSVQGAGGETFQNQTTYTVTDGAETFPLRVQTSDETQLGGSPIPGGAFEYTGVVGEFSGEYQLIPVRESDLQSSLSFSFNRLFARAEEGDAPVSVRVRVFNKGTDGDVSVTAQVGPGSTAENGTDVSGFTSPQTLTFSGTDPAPKTLSLEPVDDTESEGVERLEVVLTTDDGALSSPARFTLWVQDGPAAQAPVVAGDSGAVLLDSLRQAYGDPQTLGYGIARDTLFASVHGGRDDSLRGVYTGFSKFIPAGSDPTEAACNGDSSSCTDPDDINTEHAWPQSLGAGEEPARSNMHILFPVRADVNSARSNYAFGEVPDPDADSWFFRDQSRSSAPPQDVRALWSEVDDSPTNRGDRRFEPRHERKGDVARAVLYFAMAYPARADLSFLETQRETLLDWHEQDPVDATELRRTLIQASYQDNKVNPFVLDSTLAGRAYDAGLPEPEVVSIQQARAQGGGSVTVEGVVTRVGADGPYIQDDTGGLYVFESEGAFGNDLGDSIRRGTRLKVTGTLEYYNGLLELTNVPDDGYDVLAQGEPLPEASVLTLGDIAQNGEDYEGELVRVEDFGIDADGDETFQSDGSAGNYTIQDGTGSLTLRIPSGSELAGEPIPDQASFEGPLGQFNGEGFGADPPDSGYQLIALNTQDLEPGLPAETTVDVTRSFGDPSTGDSYRLLALPGQVDRSLASTLSGEAGIDWQAYWDNGSDQDFFLKFDGSDQFTFRPGRGFWVLSTSDWSVETTVSTVSVENDAATIPLHDGWNIVSNPLPRNVAWSAVDNAHDGGLQALWQWDGGRFQPASTFASAAEGEAFYFLNDQGLSQLTIPVPPPGGGSATLTEKDPTERAVELVAQRGDAPGARVQVGEHPAAADGKDGQDLVAPPLRFANLSLSVRAPFTDAVPERQGRLARDARPTGTAGQTYTLELRADTTGPVTVRASSLPEAPQVGAALLNPTTGRPHDLQTDGSMTLTAGSDPTRVKLLVGTASYITSEAQERLPETVTVRAPSPNPFRDRTTLRYTLPEAQEVTVAVFDLLGRRVQTLADGRRQAGTHRVTWEGTGASQQRLASGTYFLRVSTDTKQHVEKVVLVR